MRSVLAAMGVLTLTLCATPSAAQEAPTPDDAEEAPEEEARVPEADVLRYPPSSVRFPLIVGGSFVTLAAYGITVASALTWDDVPGADAMLIPVVGPWVALAQNDCAPDDPDCGAILVLRGILLVIDGIVQAGGLGLIGEGIFMTTEADAPAEEKKAGWSLAPMISPTQAGLGVAGSF